jgi:hypothetical protein
MKHQYTKLLALCLGLSALLFSSSSELCSNEWGFFGHRRINRMAVFTLPPEMIPFFKKNIEYVTDHAVDPDKRRYATKHEAVRHYIDLDEWGVYPFPDLPRDWTGVLAKYTDVYFVTPENDTFHLFGNEVSPIIEQQNVLVGEGAKAVFGKDSIGISLKAYKDFFFKNIEKQYYEDEWVLDSLQTKELLYGVGKPQMAFKKSFAIDRFSQHGIVPYNLKRAQAQLTKAFMDRDAMRILRASAELGHYIGDAHVPLHTTSNYNGQLTDQVGIHGFWESRIPELFADETYNFFVGKAKYIDDTADFYWDVVLESHQLVDSVLLIEKRLSQTYPKDKQYCYEQRLEATVLQPCKDYAKTYQDAMKGMVEKRMREAINSIGSAWYTAWVDAGQPDLSKLNYDDLSKAERQEMQQEEKMFEEGKIIGRPHEE